MPRQRKLSPDPVQSTTKLAWAKQVRIMLLVGPQATVRANPNEKAAISQA
jgi:hypothetical protein